MAWVSCVCAHHLCFIFFSLLICSSDNTKFSPARYAFISVCPFTVSRSFSSKKESPQSCPRFSFQRNVSHLNCSYYWWKTNATRAGRREEDSESNRERRSEKEWDHNLCFLCQHTLQRHIPFRVFVFEFRQEYSFLYVFLDVIFIACGYSHIWCLSYVVIVHPIDSKRIAILSNFELCVPVTRRRHTTASFQQIRSLPMEWFLKIFSTFLDETIIFHGFFPANYFLMLFILFLTFFSVFSTFFFRIHLFPFSILLQISFAWIPFQIAIIIGFAIFMQQLTCTLPLGFTFIIFV